MEWLDEIIDRVNAADGGGEWATKSQFSAWEAIDKLGLFAIPDNVVVDLVGCLIDRIVWQAKELVTAINLTGDARIEIERLTRERDALLACRQGDQRCHECPDTGCCDNVTQPQCQACNDTGRITISVGGMAMLSHVCECVNRNDKQRETNQVE